jgi:hypothetical protein
MTVFCNFAVFCNTKQQFYLVVVFHLKRSWPAVSQICNFTDFPPTLIILLPNSTPIVWLESCLTAIIQLCKVLFQRQTNSMKFLFIFNVKNFRKYAKTIILQVQNVIYFTVAPICSYHFTAEILPLSFRGNDLIYCPVSQIVSNLFKLKCP